MTLLYTGEETPKLSAKITFSNNVCITAICNINHKTKKIKKKLNSRVVEMTLLFTVEETPNLSAKITLSNKQGEALLMYLFII